MGASPQSGQCPCLGDSLTLSCQASSEAVLCPTVHLPSLSYSHRHTATPPPPPPPPPPQPPHPPPHPPRPPLPAARWPAACCPASTTTCPPSRWPPRASICSPATWPATSRAWWDGEGWGGEGGRDGQVGGMGRREEEGWAGGRGREWEGRRAGEGWGGMGRGWGVVVVAAVHVAVGHGPCAGWRRCL